MISSVKIDIVFQQLATFMAMVIGMTVDLLPQLNERIEKLKKLKCIVIEH